MKIDNKEWKAKYQAYIKSREWYDLKIDLLEKRGCFCEKCGRKKLPQVLHIHHITYERLFNERSQDLLILCPICHMKEHGLIKPKIKRPHKRKKAKSYQKSKKKKDVSKIIYQRERIANEKFTGAKRRKMKGKRLAAWQQ